MFCFPSCFSRPTRKATIEDYFKLLTSTNTLYEKQVTQILVKTNDFVEHKSVEGLKIFLHRHLNCYENVSKISEKALKILRTSTKFAKQITATKELLERAKKQLNTTAWALEVMQGYPSDPFYPLFPVCFERALAAHREMALLAKSIELEEVLSDKPLSPRILSDSFLSNFQERKPIPHTPSPADPGDLHTPLLQKQE